MFSLINVETLVFEERWANDPPTALWCWSARLWYLHCIGIRDTAVLYWSINFINQELIVLLISIFIYQCLYDDNLIQERRLLRRLFICCNSFRHREYIMNINKTSPWVITGAYFFAINLVNLIILKHKFTHAMKFWEIKETYP